MFGAHTSQKKAMTPLHVMVGLPIALASVTAPARVEIETPEPPTPAVIDSQRVLIYELHITSSARTPLELRRIEVQLERRAGEARDVELVDQDALRVDDRRRRGLRSLDLDAGRRGHAGQGDGQPHHNMQWCHGFLL